MKAILFDSPGDESVLYLGERDDPTPSENEVLIDVHATAVNRADLLQRRGLYPPPPEASDILGLECAGVVAALGQGVERLSTGDRVMALLPGGGYAERVVADADSVMPIPEAMPFTDAAAIPETYLTAYLNIFLLGGIDAGDRVLVHGGSGGVGTAAIRLCNETGITIYVTAGSRERAERCQKLGADAAIDYSTEDFAARVRDLTSEAGVDLIVDPVGAPYLEKNLALLSTEGRLVLIALMGGHSTGIDLAKLLSKRLSVIGSTLRSRTFEEKGVIVRAFLDEFREALEKRRIEPVLDRVMPLEEAAAAHRLMNEGGHFGKIVLKVG